MWDKDGLVKMNLPWILLASFKLLILVLSDAALVNLYSLGANLEWRFVSARRVFVRT
ncbi:hypothetical protein BDW60DRAFT_14236 [Aspergillus nidulans var. acristatus]